MLRVITLHTNKRQGVHVENAVMYNVEVAFCVWFAVEIIAKMLVHRMYFFINKDGGRAHLPGCPALGSASVPLWRHTRSFMLLKPTLCQTSSKPLSRHFFCSCSARVSLILIDALLGLQGIISCLIDTCFDSRSKNITPTNNNITIKLQMLRRSISWDACACAWSRRAMRRSVMGCQEAGMMRLETLMELEFINSSFSSLSSYRNWTSSSPSSNSRQQYLSQQYPHPSWMCSPARRTAIGTSNTNNNNALHIYIYICIVMYLCMYVSMYVCR